MKTITKFTTKSGKEIEICEPSLEKVQELTDFINDLTAEDTFLSLTGKPKTLEEEIGWIKNVTTSIEQGRAYVVWAMHEGRVVGNCDYNRGGTRDWHVGRIGLMVAKNHRQEGIGRFLMEHVITKARKDGLKIVALDCFADNVPAISLYRKLGFKKFACLPKGFFRKNRYCDEIKMYKNI